MFGNRIQKISFLSLIFFWGIFALVILQTSCLSSFGGTPEGKRLERMRTSKMYKDGKFENDPFVPNIVSGTYTNIIWRQLFGNEQRTPPSSIPVVYPKSFSPNASPGLRTIWLGHASVLVEIDEVRILTDPVFSNKVSPFKSVGPERFFPPPISLENLPSIDAVVISHDHYDHLDMDTAKYLASKGTKYFVPLGIGAHLEHWGIPENQIIELDWWEKGNVGKVEIVCTPAVHYSGRGLLNGKSTLWASWSIIGPKNKFFHSGDTGYSPHFAEIGKRLGPFDLTSIKIGAYDITWEGIHMNPEKAVQAHLDLKAKRMLPIHWGTFNLAIHHWDEPILRIVKSAKQYQIDLVTPKPGEVVVGGTTFVSKAWWEKVR
ncbi:MBL fold metallo-hydrolase [Leptospira borgpetersenii]|uniref:Beta-lactamase family protein n=1 Tax=Leptospira borgpetersenii serovar Ballum TaxID=280505 RepID=A0A0E3B1W8_LEPBO|nr:MBL fold metallo-hydrolase [Leptospira borgpetersenii]EMO10687.1 beta-lactamase family protein [Leptospira borgpetersenii str. Noumea 25]ALO26822.1 beta-lactamase family protein [Leptospira borgpetersenii serovar Ballum]ANH01343.1 Beta-lactamase family protein [Leptospira borgpetersenii str. 4E]EKR01372.1 beta-lactamase family protein [Leptospira borgpetersenii serovar Castellonis str. 200801910]KGE23077.1 beta-lactamase [Leptospira borgpetersenii serovar Ballum]